MRPPRDGSMVCLGGRCGVLRHGWFWFGNDREWRSAPDRRMAAALACLLGRRGGTAATGERLQRVAASGAPRGAVPVRRAGLGGGGGRAAYRRGAGPYRRRA